MLIVGAGYDLEAPTPEQMATLPLQIGERLKGPVQIALLLKGTGLFSGRGSSGR